MTRLRFGLVVTIYVGVVYAAAGLFSSLRDFGVGVSVAAVAWLVYGFLDFRDEHQRQLAILAAYEAQGQR